MSSITQTEKVIGELLLRVGQRLNRPLATLGPKSWRITMRNSDVEYVIEINVQGPWCTFGAVLMRDVVGHNKAQFYRRILEMSAGLLGAHIGVEQDRLVIVSEDKVAFTNEDSLEASIAVFDAAYRKAFRAALNLANELGVRIRSN